MAILITDDGNTLKVVIDGASPKYLSKSGAKVHVEGSNVVFTDNENNQYNWLYTNVSTPSNSSADDLANTIQNYLDTSADYNVQASGVTYTKQLVDMSFGTKGYVFESGLTAITGITSGTYYAVVFPETTVLNLLTITGVTGDNESGETVPANHVIYGDITAIAISSGSFRLYKK